jgi:hypothetical protein
LFTIQKAQKNGEDLKICFGMVRDFSQLPIFNLLEYKHGVTCSHFAITLTLLLCHSILISIPLFYITLAIPCFPLSLFSFARFQPSASLPLQSNDSDNKHTRTSPTPNSSFHRNRALRRDFLSKQHTPTSTSRSFTLCAGVDLAIPTTTNLLHLRTLVRIFALARR